jgi:hypothetical protein
MSLVESVKIKQDSPWPCQQIQIMQRLPKLIRCKIVNLIPCFKVSFTPESSQLAKLEAIENIVAAQHCPRRAERFEVDRPFWPSGGLYRLGLEGRPSPML